MSSLNHHLLSLRFFLLVLAAFLLPTSSFASTQSNVMDSIVVDVPTITASIQPLGLLAQAISGYRAEVTTLLSANASAHHYALSIADRQNLASSDLVIWVGPDLEGFLQKPIKQRESQGRLTITAADLPHINWPEPRDTSKQDSHGHHHSKGHDHGDRNPHIWLNPLNLIAMIPPIVEKISSMAPQYAEYYQENAKILRVALQQKDAALIQSMLSLQGKPFIVSHPAYDHFVSRYDLFQLDYVAITPERHAGAKHLYELRQQQNVRCVIADKGASSVASDQLSSHLNVPVVVLDPLGINTADVELSHTEEKARDARAQLMSIIEMLADGFRQCLS